MALTSVDPKVLLYSFAKVCIYFFFIYLCMCVYSCCVYGDAHVTPRKTGLLSFLFFFWSSSGTPNRIFQLLYIPCFTTLVSQKANILILTTYIFFFIFQILLFPFFKKNKINKDSNIRCFFPRVYSSNMIGHFSFLFFLRIVFFVWLYFKYSSRDNWVSIIFELNDFSWKKKKRKKEKKSRTSVKYIPLRVSAVLARWPWRILLWWWMRLWKSVRACSRKCSSDFLLQHCPPQVPVKQKTIIHVLFKNKQTNYVIIF